MLTLTVAGSPPCEERNVPRRFYASKRLGPIITRDRVVTHHRLSGLAGPGPSCFLVQLVRLPSTQSRAHILLWSTWAEGTLCPWGWGGRWLMPALPRKTKFKLYHEKPSLKILCSFIKALNETRGREGTKRGPGPTSKPASKQAWPANRAGLARQQAASEKCCRMAGKKFERASNERVPFSVPKNSLA
jgi:hypothetical protein